MDYLPVQMRKKDEKQPKSFPENLYWLSGDLAGHTGIGEHTCLLDLKS